MRKRNKSKAFIVIIIGILLIIFLIFISLFNRTTSNNLSIVSNIEDMNEAYNVKTCVNKFYLFCKDYIVSNPNYIYELIDDEYLKYYNLNEKNFKENLDTFDSDQIQIDKVYKVNQNENLALYIINAKQLYKNKDTQKDFNLLLKIDNNNNTFSVYLNNYINDKGYNNLKLGDKVNLKISNIQEKTYNKFDSSRKTTPDNVEDIFKEYVNNCIFYENRAYNLLDSVCKSSKFSTYEDFDKYITENIRDIVLMDLYSYEDEQKEGYIEYRCKSDKGQSYIFKVTSYITYTVSIE